MRCPSCKDNNDKVLDSRSTEDGGTIRRRRMCVACGRRFTTKERIEEEVRLTVIKRDGSRVPYRRDKVTQGIRQACYKLPIGDDEVEHLTDTVEEAVFQEHEHEVSSYDIGRYVAQALRRKNHVAYVRFMSVYRKFTDVEEFVTEIREAKERSAVEAPNQQTLF